MRQFAEKRQLLKFGGVVVTLCYFDPSAKSGRLDSNQRPLEPHSSALAKLRHAPICGIQREVGKAEFSSHILQKAEATARDVQWTPAAKNWFREWCGSGPCVRMFGS